MWSFSIKKCVGDCRQNKTLESQSVSIYSGYIECLAIFHYIIHLFTNITVSLIYSLSLRLVKEWKVK